MLDGETVDFLRSLATPQKPRYFAEVVSKYAREAQKYAEAIRGAVKNHDLELVSKSAHALRGSDAALVTELDAAVERAIRALDGPPPLDRWKSWAEMVWSNCVQVRGNSC